MSGITQWQAQALIYQALIQDSELTSLLANGANSIFDAVPAHAAFPYLSFTESRASFVETQRYQALQVDMVFDVWSEYQGFKELKGIAAIIQKIFQQGDIENVDGKLILVKQTSSEVTREGDGKTRKLHEKWRFIFEANAE